MNALLDHVATSFHDPCTDPDCEVHHPEVGVEEDTVTEAEVAFFLAGAEAMVSKLLTLMDDSEDMDLLDAVDNARFEMRRTFSL